MKEKEIKNNSIYEVESDGFYYEDGTFRPLTSRHGNIDSELSHLRNTYMESEREYFKFLLSEEKIRNAFQKLIMNYNSEELFKEAISIQNKIETGILETKEDLEKMKTMTPEEKDDYHMMLLEHAEGMMCLLLAATRDKVRMLNLVKALESNELIDSKNNKLSLELEHANKRRR